MNNRMCYFQHGVTFPRNRWRQIDHFGIEWYDHLPNSIIGIYSTHQIRNTHHRLNDCNNLLDTSQLFQINKYHHVRNKNYPAIRKQPIVTLLAFRTNVR